MTEESYDPSYYDVLGVPESASTAEITSTFRRAMRRSHPDTASEELEQMDPVQLNAIHATLRDDREGYDRRLHEHRRAAGAASRAPRRGQDHFVQYRMTHEAWRSGATIRARLDGLPLTIPARPRHRARVRYQGRGWPGENGGRHGDLVVEIVHVGPDGRPLLHGHD